MRISALTMTDRISPCASATSSRPAGLCDMRAVMIAPLPTKTRAKVPMNSAAKWRHASRICCPRLRKLMGPRRVRSLDHPTQYQRGVYSAEAEGVREYVLHAFLPPGSWQKVKIAGLVRNLKVDRRWQPFPLDRERANGRFDRSGCAECVAVIPLSSTHRNPVRAIAQHLLDRHCLGRVVERSRAPVGVDVVDLARGHVRVIERQPHRSRRLRAVWARSRHVVCVIRRAVAGNLGVNRCAPRVRSLVLFENE